VLASCYSDFTALGPEEEADLEGGPVMVDD
jgi:hypothetical protein